MTLYVLAGHDSNGAFKDEIALFEQRQREKGDVVVLHAKAGQSIEDLADQIKAPAEILLNTHGSKTGRFTWHEGESVSYSDFFKALPRQGISSVTIESCYGGIASAKEMMEGLPPGTLLQSVVGSKVSAWAKSGTQFGEELIASQAGFNQLSIMLEALDNTDPNLFKTWQDRQNRWIDNNPEEAEKKGKIKEELNPNEVLPHTIGLGGDPATTINLNERMAVLSAQGKAGTMDMRIFNQAVALVTDHFDNDAGELTGESEQAVDERVNRVAAALKNGADTSRFGLDEKRVAYALTAANMHLSGEMARLISQAQGHSAPQPPQVEPPEHTPASPTSSVAPVAATTTSTSQAKPKPEKPQHPAPQPAPSKPKPLTRAERIARANEAFGASAEEIRDLQQDLHDLGKDLGPYGSIDANGKWDGIDGIHGRFTQAAWVSAQKDLKDRGIIQEISQKYNPEIAVQIKEYTAQKLQAMQTPTAGQEQANEPAQTPPPEEPTPPPAPLLEDPAAAPTSSTANPAAPTPSWLAGAAGSNMSVEPPEPDWMQNATPANQSVATELAEVRGENASHDMEQRQAHASVPKEKETAAVRK